MNNKMISGLGKFIRYKRENSLQKNSLNSFALNNDIEPAILSRIENGKQDIKFNILVKIAKGFNLKTSELIAEFENSQFF